MRVDANKKYFLDTSFIIHALLDEKKNASDFFNNFFNSELNSSIYINIIVLSELLNALENIYFEKYCEKTDITEDEKKKKKWRNSGDESYNEAISEYRGILEILKPLDFQILAIQNGTAEIEKLLETKINHPYLDANDCIHFFHLEEIDFIVTGDSDFHKLNSEKVIIIYN